MVIPNIQHLSFIKKIPKSYIGWPKQPQTEKVPNVSKKLNFWWSIPQKGTSIGHLGARDDQTFRIRKFFEEIVLMRPVRLQAPLRSIRLEMFFRPEKSLLRTLELSRILNSIIWASTNITIFWFFEKNLSIFSVWGLPMLLFWNFFDETQMLNIGKHAIYHECFLMLQNPTKIMIFNLSFCTETPCMRHKKNNVWTFDPINSLLVNFL